MNFERRARRTSFGRLRARVRQRGWLASHRTRRVVAFLLAVAIALAILTGLSLASWVSRKADAIDQLSAGGRQTFFYGADGRRWFPLEEHRRDVPLDRISIGLQRAVIAIEDHRFGLHPGIDPLAMARALFRNAREGAIVEGGSTLTQQLARTLFLSRSRTFRRKLEELMLALMIERRLPKRRILELYLNRIYLGGNVYGVEAMSRNVFGKSAADLSLAESAFLAGLIRMPSGLSPWSHFDRALRRSRVVLRRMREEDYISRAEERAAAENPPRVLPEPGLGAEESGYAASFLRQEFRERLGSEAPDGWIVRTTFVPSLQAEAERAVREGLRRLDVPGLQAALVALDPETGDLLALVGGSDFRRSPFNRAVHARRQPGSAFKPVLYAAALESGWSPISVVSGLSVLRVEGHEEWTVREAAAEPRDALTLREALVQSNNRAAVRLQDRIGSAPVLRLAHLLGLQNLPDVPSLALGTGEVTPLELTAAYAAFANGGFAVLPRAVAEIVDAEGSTVLQQPVRRARVLSEATAFQMVSLLQDVIDRGTGTAARSLGVDFPAAGKTGTTDAFRDAWFVGFTSSVVAGVWVGLDQPAPLASDGFGSRYALPIWVDFMTRAAERRAPEPFRLPPSVTEVLVCEETYLRAGDRCPAYRELFDAEDVLPQEVCRAHGGDPLREAGEELGGFFKKLGRGLRKIFRR